MPVADPGHLVVFLHKSYTVGDNIELEMYCMGD